MYHKHFKNTISISFEPNIVMMNLTTDAELLNPSNSAETNLNILYRWTLEKSQSTKKWISSSMSDLHSLQIPSSTGFC
jgi:hypothetical protein